MRWYRIAEAPAAHRISFLQLDNCYYPSLLLLRKMTHRLDSFMAYIDPKENVLGEYMVEEERKSKAEFGRDFFFDRRRFSQYKRNIKTVTSDIDRFKSKVDALSLERLTARELLNVWRKAAALYQRSLSLYLLTQPEYSSGIEQEIVSTLKRHIHRSKVQRVMSLLAVSDVRSCLGQERCDWLCHVVIPAKKKRMRFETARNDKMLQQRIARHLERYKYYPASCESDPWDYERYLSLLRRDLAAQTSELKRELSMLQGLAGHTRRIKINLIARHSLPAALFKKINIIAELGILRINLRVLGWQFFDYFIPRLIEESAKKLGVTALQLGLVLSVLAELNRVQEGEEEKKKFGMNALIWLKICHCK